MILNADPRRKMLSGNVLGVFGSVWSIMKAETSQQYDVSHELHPTAYLSPPSGGTLDSTFHASLSMA